MVLNNLIEEKFLPEEKCGDKTHPFKSGAQTLKIFRKLNLLESKNNTTLNTESIVNSLYGTLINSVEVSKITDGIKRFKPSLTRIDEIIKNMKLLKDNLKYGQFVYDVVVLVTFHQSLPNIESHMNKDLLSKENIKDLFDHRLLELMRALMINDSAAHSLHKGVVYSEELNKNIDIVRDWLDEI